MERVNRAFAEQARACAALGSPFMQGLMQRLPGVLPPRLAADLMAVKGEIGPNGASLPLRLAAGLHALVLAGEAPDLARAYPPGAADLTAPLRKYLIQHEKFLADWIRTAPQTNEVGRSAVLMALGCELTARFGLPLVLTELGASAGLNLCFDRYRLDLGGAAFGDSGAQVCLAPEWFGQAPPQAALTVAARAGCDLNPLDPKADARRLLAYVWPDQPERLARMRLALAQAQAQAGPGLVTRQGADRFVAQRLARPALGCCHLIYHTIAHQYFAPDQQARIAARIEAAGQRAGLDAPLAWFGMEADGRGEGAGLWLRLWPGDLRLDLGRAGFHGQWVHWRGLAP